MSYWFDRVYKWTTDEYGEEFDWPALWSKEILGANSCWPLSYKEFDFKVLTRGACNPIHFAFWWYGRTKYPHMLTPFSVPGNLFMPHNWFGPGTHLFNEMSVTRQPLFQRPVPGLRNQQQLLFGN